MDLVPGPSLPFSKGESLFHPWRVPSTRKRVRRNDGVLATSIRRLKSGEDEEEVLATLHLHVDELPRETRRHYERAVASLEEAAGGDHGRALDLWDTGVHEARLLGRPRNGGPITLAAFGRSCTVLEGRAFN